MKWLCGYIVTIGAHAYFKYGYIINQSKYLLHLQFNLLIITFMSQMSDYQSSCHALSSLHVFVYRQYYDVTITGLDVATCIPNKPS